MTHQEGCPERNLKRPTAQGCWSQLTQSQSADAAITSKHETKPTSHMTESAENKTHLYHMLAQTAKPLISPQKLAQRAQPYAGQEIGTCQEPSDRR